MSCTLPIVGTRHLIVARGDWRGSLSLALWVLLGAACGDGSASRDRPDVPGADSDTSEPTCNPVSDTGCPDDETCTWVPSAADPVCVRRGPVPLEGVCSTTAGCERGVCLSLNASVERCYATCELDTDCGDRGTCLTLTASPFNVCRIGGVYDVCDLLEQDCAPRRDTDRGCYVVPNEATPVCLPAGKLDADAECEGPTACRSGYACVDDVCVPWCDADTANTCGALFQCRPYAYGAGVCEQK